MSGMTTSLRTWRFGIAAVILVAAAAGSLPASATGQTSDERAPVSRAVDPTDGGHAALIAMLRRMGRPVPEDLVKDASQRAARITVAEMAFRSAQAGLPAVILPVPVRCLRPALASIPLPAIALVGTRYVIIESHPAGGIATLLDPRDGRVRAPLASLGRDWKDAVVTFGVPGQAPVLPCE